jgi:hypothetical protein
VVVEHAAVTARDALAAADAARKHITEALTRRLAMIRTDDLASARDHLPTNRSGATCIPIDF